MFSERTAWELGENDFAAKLRMARERGEMLLDLTVSNPTHCSFAYDEALLAPLSTAGALEYDPDPTGMKKARAAVARYYADHGAVVDADRICLTTSTSEAYSYLFRLLCDPGDDVLIARPSYPLFEYIARLDGVITREFPLHYDPGAGNEPGGEQGWAIDLDAVDAMIGPRTRAVILVHPNNPTGSFVSDAERHALQKLCAERDLALIVDEVFLDYGFAAEPPRTFADGESAALTFVLSGISKVCGLPQMKASWAVACGPERLVAEAMQRLEVIADTFLSMNAPVQHALPAWLAARQSFQRQVLERMRANVRALDLRLAGSQAQRLALQGGWTAVLRVPVSVRGVEFAEAALEKGVIVQPGEFYGLPAGRAVVSLLTSPDVWERGLALLPVDG